MTTDAGTYIILAAWLLAAAACWTDLLLRRIPNTLVLIGVAAGLALNTLSAGLAGVERSIEGGALGLAVFLPFMVLGGMGAGDVKLMAALGALLGPANVLGLALVAALAGGLLALLRVAWEGRLRATVRGIAELLWFWAHTGLRPSPTLNLSNPGTIRIPYAVPIAAGTVVVTLFQWSRS